MRSGAYIIAVLQQYNTINHPSNTSRTFALGHAFVRPMGTFIVCLTHVVVKNEYVPTKYAYNVLWMSECNRITTRAKISFSLSLPLSLIWGGTRSLLMPALRPASQAGPMRNPREGTSVVLRDTIRLT